MPYITNVSISANVSIGQKRSDGSFVVSATIYNNATSTRTGCRVSVGMTNSGPWSRIGSYSIAGGGSASGSVTMYSGNTSDDTVYIYLLYGEGQAGVGGGYSVQGYVDPTPAFYKKTISVSPTTVVMGNNVSISESSGTGVSSTTRTWSAGGSSGSFTTGNWNVSTSVFEPLTPNSNSINITFTVYSSGAGGSGSDSKTIKANVPSNYLPSCDHTYEMIDPINNSLISGTSKLKVTLYPTLVPAGNSATISSVTLKSVTTTNPSITTNSFSKSGNVFTSGVLPTMANVPSYTFTMTFLIVDSRGNQLEYTTGTFRVTNFVPPYCNITSLTRDSSTTGTLNVYINSPSTPTFATVKVGDGTAVDVLSSITHDSGDIYSLEYHFSGLQSGNQYNVTFSFRNQDMVDYGESAYAYTQLLSTMSMPISLFDNGTRMAVSFGEECADDYGQTTVINFAKDSYIRYIRNNVAKLEKAEDVFFACPFPVGGIYISTSNTSPSTIWSGTSWSQIQDTFLLSAGSTYTAGATGGEATHTLTTDEIPSHTHSVSGFNYGSEECQRYTDNSKTVGSNDGSTITSGTAGGGQAHNNMPPYLVVYMWERTA